MTTDPTARLDIMPIWRGVNAMLIDLVDLVPDDRMNWSLKPELWSIRRLFMHLCDAREEWMTRAINDGETNVGYREALGKSKIKEALEQTWQRVERSVADQARMDAVYKDRWWAEAPPYNGHWVAFHLLEHDIHHRADLYMYLALLGVETPVVHVT